jgi:hypothetical protein
MRRRRWSRRRADRGAVAVIVALVVGSGVLLGMAALVVDVGNIHVEREQLQSGADAGVIRIAQTCAVGPTGCASAAGIARRYADANAVDGRSGIGVVCGRGGHLAACPAPSGRLTDCVRSAPASGNYVEVHADTLLPDGATVLPPVFAQALVKSYRGPAVSACARAGWGAPTSARLALAISVCDWDRYTGAGTSYPDPPTEQIIDSGDDPNAGVCHPPGATTPGGFGWLDDPGGDCRRRVVADGTYRGDPAGMSPACEAVLERARRSGRALLMPVYDAVTARGGVVGYTVLGFAAFVVTGWRLPGSSVRSTLTGRSSCDRSTVCVYGYFTRTTMPGNGPTGGPDLGAAIVGLVG